VRGFHEAVLHLITFYVSIQILVVVVVVVVVPGWSVELAFCLGGKFLPLLFCQEGYHTALLPLQLLQHLKMTRNFIIRSGIRQGINVTFEDRFPATASIR
jgi:hypothetical protein